MAPQQGCVASLPGCAGGDAGTGAYRVGTNFLELPAGSVVVTDHRDPAGGPGPGFSHLTVGSAPGDQRDHCRDYSRAVASVTVLSRGVAIPLSAGIPEKPLRPEPDRVDTLHVHYGDGA